MISSLVLNKEIQCETICKEVQHLINKYNSEHGNANDTVLVLSIKKIVDAVQHFEPLRIEDKTTTV